MSISDLSSTATGAYARRLKRLQDARWKRILEVQAPYRWHVRHLKLGRVLDVGCGIGRNLAHLEGRGIGVDHNADAVAIARGRGLTAYTSDEWPHAPEATTRSFDSILLAHVLEHMNEEQAISLVQEYLPYVRSGGKIVFITPQERGYASDPTHVRLVDFAEIEKLCHVLVLAIDQRRSFPFPRVAGRLFLYNEFVVVATTL